MFRPIISIYALLASFIIVCMGNSLQTVLLPARASLEHFSEVMIGAMMSGYYAGFIAGTFICPWLIARVGHIRVFAASCAGACAVMLIHALFINPWIWIALRVLYGLCLVHLFTVMESWLNSVGEKGTRGKILSVYMIANFISSFIGQMLFFVAPAKGFQLFSLCSILLSLSLVPLILSRITPPPPVPLDSPEQYLGIRKLYRISPLGVIGALTAGLMTGAYWGLTAVYILGIGFSQNDVAWFMAASLLGGLVAQWPLGALFDRNRRYAIMLSLALITIAAIAITSMAFWDMQKAPFGIVFLLVFGIIFGTGFHPFYSLCMAHTNDFVPAGSYVHASAGLQLTQSIGAAAGPLIASFLMHAMGNRMLYMYIALLSGSFILYRLLIGRRQNT